MYTYKQIEMNYSYGYKKITHFINKLLITAKLESFTEPFAHNRIKLVKKKVQNKC